MKYAIQKTDRHGKVRWYYHRQGSYWALPCDPSVDSREYDALAAMFSSGYAPKPPVRNRRRRDRPEAPFIRGAEAAIKRARQRANQWGREFDIEVQWVIDAMISQRFRCALTGIPFGSSEPGERNPYAPSLDRIDCRGGYTKDNVRVVLLSVNLALADWGEQHFAEICQAYLANRIGAETHPAAVRA